MNAELYLRRDGKTFAKTAESAFEGTVKLLGEIDVNIIYKTEISMTKSSVSEALKETKSGEDKIDLVIIADALETNNKDDAKKLFEELGINERIKTIEAPVTAPGEGTAENKKSHSKNRIGDDTVIIESSSALKIDDGADDEADKAAEEQPKASDNNTGDKTEKSKSSDTVFAYSAEYNGMLIILLPTEEFTGLDFDTILYSVSCAALNPKRKNAFWRRIIPCSGDTPFDVIRKVILMVAIITFIVSSSMLINILLIRPAINDNTTGSIRNMLVSGSETDENGNEITKKPTDGSQGTLVDFSELYKQNKDTFGWITVPNTRIDYVVVKPPKDEDPEYYLYRDFYKNYDAYGTIFMDYRSSLDAKNYILHGHHMQDGRMFANLLNYEDFDFYKKTPTFTFNTIYEKSQWKIISIFKTNTLEEHGKFFNYLRGEFDNDYDFLNFVYQVRERSLYDCPVDVNENDTLVTLSTCAYDFSEFRFVVVARKVRDGESTKVDVSKANINPDTLYPDVWYRVRGGTKPDVTTFQDAFNNKKIDWYDGKNKKWSEKDDENLTKVLTTGKNNALKEINKYISSRKYRTAEQKKIDGLVTKYTKLINDATSGTEINELYAKALNEFSKIKTEDEISAQKEASDKEVSNQELRSKKVSSKSALYDSIAGNKYYPAERTKVEALLKEYGNKIESAKTIEAVEKFKKEGISKISEIKTSEEVAEQSKNSQSSKNQTIKNENSPSEPNTPKPESSGQPLANTSNPGESSKKPGQSSKPSSSSKPESSKPSEETSVDNDAEKLEEEKGNAINAIYNYLDINSYYQNQQVEIYTILNKYENLINSAESTDEISGYVDNAKRELDTILTAEEIGSSNPPVDEQTTPEPEE